MRCSAILKRRFFNVASSFSALALILTAVFWVRGYYIRDSIGYSTLHEGMWHHTGLDFSNGGVFFSSAHVSTKYVNPSQPAPPLGLRFGSGRNTAPTFLIGWSHYGFFSFSSNMYPDDPNGGVPFSQAGVPYWFLILMFGVLPVLWISSRSRRMRRGRVGLCRQCGYDLRASPERCPECGASVTGSIACPSNAS